MKNGPSSLEKPEIITIDVGGNVVSVEDFGKALSRLPDEQFFDVLKAIVQQGRAPDLKALIEALEIQATPSRFDDPAEKKRIEEVALEYPFSRWLEGMGIHPTQADRRDICTWWETGFIPMAAEAGSNIGQINETSHTTNLWTATAALATEMQRDPVAFARIPGILANHPETIKGALAKVSEYGPWMALLVGETLTDMRKSPTFLGAFSTVSRPENPAEISRRVKDALWSVSMILQRPKRTEKPL